MVRPRTGAACTEFTVPLKTFLNAIPNSTNTMTDS